MAKQQSNKKGYYMNKEQALEFLRNHQPMPDDDDTNFTAELLEQYDNIRIFFTENPCKESVPLFLNSFGKGDGSGIYTLIDGILFVNDEDFVIDTMSEILENPNISDAVRYWNTLFATNFSSVKFIKGLLLSLKSNDVGIKENAQYCLDLLNDSK